MHNFDNINESINGQGYTHSPICLHDNTWLGTHVVIMPGITIGEGSVVGSSSVVTKSIGNNKVYAGSPAKLIKERI